MKVLAILCTKGGVGKTTLATCLAVAAEQDGKATAIFDLDPNANASFWQDIRQADTPAVQSIQPVRLPTMLKAAEEAGAELVIIDGAAVARDIITAAAEHADLVLIPTKAAVFDTMSMTRTIEAVRAENTPFSIVLNFVPPQGQETADAFEAAGKLSAAICPVTLGNRKAYYRAQASGLTVQEYQPDSEAAKEIKRLYDYTRIHLYNEEESNEHQETQEIQNQYAASGT